MKLDINSQIYLELYSLKHLDVFYSAIHEIDNKSDCYRVRLQEKYDSKSKVEARIVDALDNKYLIDGTPDFFIFFNDKLAGVFEFAPLDQKSDFIEVGYWLFEKYRNKGILSTIFPEMIKYAKNNFDKPRLIATTALDNFASQKLLLKSGFRETGKIEEFDKGDGVLEKDMEYEILLKDVTVL